MRRRDRHQFFRPSAVECSTGQLQGGLQVSQRIDDRSVDQYKITLKRRLGFATQAFRHNPERAFVSVLRQDREAEVFCPAREIADAVNSQAFTLELLLK